MLTPAMKNTLLLRPALRCSLLTSAAQESLAATQTFSACPFGSPQQDRYILLGFYGVRGGALTLSSVTIGGVTATLVGKTTSDTNAVCEMWIANVPGGETGDVVVTVSASGSRCGYGLWRLTGLQSTTPSRASDAANQNNTVLTVTNQILGSAGGVLIGFCGINLTSTDATWSGGLNEKDFFTTSTNCKVSGSHMEMLNDYWYLPVTVTATGTYARAGLVVAGLR